MLQAFEFNANVKDGIITLPDEYKNLVKESVKVIIIQNESEKYIDNSPQSGATDTGYRIKKRLEFLEFARKNRIRVDKIEIPDREERNAR